MAEHSSIRDLLKVGRRHDERAETRRMLWCEGQQGREVETRNVSRGGMFIVADEPPAVGERLTISFRDDEGDDVEVDMEVMWSGRTVESRRPGVGVRITGFKKGEEAYDRFVSRHLDEPEQLQARRRATGG